MPDPVRTARAYVAIAIKKGDVQAERMARQAMVAAKLERAVHAALSSEPPLTGEARDRAVAMLTGGATHG